MWLCWPENPFDQRTVLFLGKQHNLYGPKHSCWPNSAPEGSKAGTTRGRWHSKAAVRKVSSAWRPRLADKGYHASATGLWPPVLPLSSFFRSRATIAGGSSTLTYISVSPWVPVQVSLWVLTGNWGPRQPVCAVGLDRHGARNLECPVLLDEQK